MLKWHQIMFVIMFDKDQLEILAEIGMCFFYWSYPKLNSSWMDYWDMNWI